MYDKNLTETVRLRISKKDMDYLIQCAECQNVSVSEVIRIFIGSFRLRNSEVVLYDAQTNIDNKL